MSHNDTQQSIQEDTALDDENIELGEIVDSGICGENATWQLDEYGTLVISGTGELYDFHYNTIIDESTGNVSTYQEHNIPWIEYTDYIKSIYIKEEITGIYAYSFINMQNLSNVKLPNTLKEISGLKEQPVFMYCPNLKNINIPNDLTTLKYAFWYCGLVSISLPNSLAEISEYALTDCSSLISIEIPDSVTKIDKYALSGCSSLINIEIPDSVTEIGMGAFLNCSSLESIYIPDSVTLIGEFDEATGEIESYVFYGCSNLQNVRLSNSITTIGHGMFYNCSKLKYLYVPNSVTEIKQAFVGCTGLETIVIPPSVNEIENGTFAEEIDGLYLTGQLDVTIQGTLGSYAQQYAEENGFNFEIMDNPN